MRSVSETFVGAWLTHVKGSCDGTVHLGSCRRSSSRTRLDASCAGSLPSRAAALLLAPACNCVRCRTPPPARASAAPSARLFFKDFLRYSAKTRRCLLLVSPTHTSNDLNGYKRDPTARAIKFGYRHKRLSQWRFALTGSSSFRSGRTFGRARWRSCLCRDMSKNSTRFVALNAGKIRPLRYHRTTSDDSAHSSQFST